jgi:hypothetical protein
MIFISTFITYFIEITPNLDVCNKNIICDVYTSGAETAYPSGAPEFTPDF